MSALLVPRDLWRHMAAFGHDVGLGAALCRGLRGLLAEDEAFWRILVRLAWADRAAAARYAEHAEHFARRWPGLAAEFPERLVSSGGPSAEFQGDAFVSPHGHEVRVDSAGRCSFRSMGYISGIVEYLSADGRYLVTKESMSKVVWDTRSGGARVAFSCYNYGIVGDVLMHDWVGPGEAVYAANLARDTSTSMFCSGELYASWTHFAVVSSNDVPEVRLVMAGSAAVPAASLDYFFGLCLRGTVFYYADHCHRIRAHDLLGQQAVQVWSPPGTVVAFALSTTIATNTYTCKIAGDGRVFAQRNDSARLYHGSTKRLELSWGARDSVHFTPDGFTLTCPSADSILPPGKYRFRTPPAAEGGPRSPELVAGGGGRADVILQ